MNPDLPLSRGKEIGKLLLQAACLWLIVQSSRVIDRVLSRLDNASQGSPSDGVIRPFVIPKR